MAHLLPLVKTIIAMQGWSESSYQARYLIALAQHPDGLTGNELTYVHLIGEGDRKNKPIDKVARQIEEKKKKYPPASQIQKLNTSLDRLYQREDAAHLPQRISIRTSPTNRQLRVLAWQDNVLGTVRRFWAPHTEGAGLNVIGYASPLFFRDPEATQFVRRIDVNSRHERAPLSVRGVQKPDFLFVTRGELHLMTELVKLLARGDNLEYDGIKYESSLNKISDMATSLAKRQPAATPNIVHAIITGSIRTNHAIALYQSATNGWSSRLQIRSTEFGATGLRGESFHDSYNTETIRSYVVVTRRPGELAPNTTCTMIASNGSVALQKMSETLTLDADLLALLATPCEQVRVRASGAIDEGSALPERPIDMFTTASGTIRQPTVPYFQLLVEVEVKGEARSPSVPRLLQVVWYDRA